MIKLSFENDNTLRIVPGTIIITINANTLFIVYILESINVIRVSF